MSLHIDRYFERIGWGGDQRPTLGTLTGVLKAQMSSIPFENLDVLLHRPLRLDLDSIEAKLVAARRGGYCFEHTTLFAGVLSRLGFDTTLHSARVVLFTPRTQSERAHMFLTTKLAEGTFVVDPGFGGPAAQFPIPLLEPGTRPIADDTHWMVRDGDRWVLRTRTDDGAAKDAWVSTLEEDYPVDFEMANHFTASHPASPFVNALMMGLFTPDGRVTLLNRSFTIRKNGTASSGLLADRAALRTFVSQHFGFDLPDIERLRVPAIPEWA